MESASTHSLQTDQGPASSEASFVFMLTLGHLAVSCPGEPSLSFMGPRHIFSVAKGLEPSSHEMGQHARREGERLAISMSSSYQLGKVGRAGRSDVHEYRFCRNGHAAGVRGHAVAPRGAGPFDVWGGAHDARAPRGARPRSTPWTTRTRTSLMRRQMNFVASG